jgi:hypothetical protein
MLPDCFKLLKIRLAETETLVTATTERHRRRAVVSRQIMWPGSFSCVLPGLGFRVPVIISELSEVGRKKARSPLMDAERTDDIVLHNPETQL